MAFEVAPIGAVAAADCLQRIDISALADEELRASIVQQAQAAEIRLAPEAGVMLQAVWFDAGAKRSGRLLVTIHHLSVDGVSWRILVPDLAAAWAAIRMAERLRCRRAGLRSGIGRSGLCGMRSRWR